MPESLTQTPLTELNSFVSLLNRWADETRSDGILKNNLLKLGASSSKDVESFNQPDFTQSLTKPQLEDITFRDPLCYRVATTMPGLMAAGGIEIKGLKPNQLKTLKRALTKSRVLKAFERASVMANIYDRGAAIVLAVDDGQPWNQKVNESRIKSVSIAFVQDGYKVIPQYSGGWSEPEYYQLSIDVTQNDTAKELVKNGLSVVHKSRVLWFPGIWCPYDVELRYQGPPSRVSLFWRAYSRYELGLSLAVNLMARISVVNFQRKGLIDLLAQNDKESESKLLREMELVQQSLNNMGIIFSDLEKHKVEIITRSLGEVANLLGRLKQMAIAASGLTEVELFGAVEAGGGLSNDDLRDRIIRANLVNTEQESYWREPMEQYLKYELIAMFGSEPDEWEVEFPSTLKLTPTEEIAALVQKTTAGASLVASQALSANELRATIAGDPVFAPYVDMKAESPADKAEREAKEQMEPEQEAEESTIEPESDPLAGLVENENA